MNVQLVIITVYAPEHALDDAQDANTHILAVDMSADADRILELVCAYLFAEYNDSSMTVRDHYDYVVNTQPILK